MMIMMIMMMTMIMMIMMIMIMMMKVPLHSMHEPETITADRVRPRNLILSVTSTTGNHTKVRT